MLLLHVGFRFSLHSASLSVHVDPVEQTVDAGNAAIFNCSVAGHPIEKLAWYKNGEPLANDTRILIHPPNKLVVRDVRRHDQGMYQCFIGNNRETVQGAAQLSLGGQSQVHTLRVPRTPKKSSP